MPTAEQRTQARLKDIRKRLRGLDRYIPFRHRRTLYWRRKAEQEPDHDLRAIYRRRERASAEKGREARHTEKVLRKREQNALEKLEHLKALDKQKDVDGDGLIVVDDHQIARGVGAEVLRIRAAGRWKGVVVSGYRTPEYSRQLCRNMCGADSCPGRCAGVNTNHARKPPQWDEHAGAVDLTDFYTFAAECRRLDSWLENHLPQDLVHFSDSGN